MSVCLEQEDEPIISASLLLSFLFVYKFYDQKQNTAVLSKSVFSLQYHMVISCSDESLLVGGHGGWAHKVAFSFVWEKTPPNTKLQEHKKERGHLQDLYHYLNCVLCFHNTVKHFYHRKSRGQTEDPNTRHQGSSTNCSLRTLSQLSLSTQRSFLMSNLHALRLDSNFPDNRRNSRHDQ